jgi:dTDP-4-dehydrorhamnose reductase
MARSGARRMLVTGAGGMVGAYVTAVFADWTVELTAGHGGGHKMLDVRDRAAVAAAVDAVRPEVVLHLAAATDVDRCEQEPDWAYANNAIGTENVVLACRASDATAVVVSTAAVFPGDRPEPYVEYDEPGPVNVYGRSKLAAERLAQSLWPRSYVVRAGWMIGGGTADKKFVGKIARLMLGGERLVRAVDDKVGSPVYARDFLVGVRSLLESERYGVYHVVNPGSCSRYEIALAVRDALGRADVDVLRVSSTQFPLPAPRGHEAIRNLKLELLGFPALRPWREALTEYVERELRPALAGGARRT